jgi:hypothetical protein
VLASLASCDTRRGEPKISEKVLAAIRAEEPGIKSDCLEAVRWGGFEAMPRSLEKCFEMTPRQRWTGLWRNEFEGSRFCPAPAAECKFDTKGDRIWLSSTKDMKLGIEAERPGGLYAVEFEGRRTLHPGHYGHMGVSDHEIFVDRLISIKEIEAPYQPTKADYDSMIKQCRSVPGCSMKQIEDSYQKQFGDSPG